MGIILVTGATGTNGAEVARLLSASGQRFRAMVRSPEQARELSSLPGAEVVQGDFDDPTSLTRALGGVDRAFLVTPSSERAEARQLGFVEAARRAGVDHVVKLSQIAASADSPVRFLRYHAAVEGALRSSGMGWTFLRPNLFMQGLLAFAGAIRERGSFGAAIDSDARVSVVDVRDIAASAVAALVGEGHRGQIYDLTGPQALTHPEIADIISAATGRPVSFEPVSSVAMRAALSAAGMGDWQADGLIEDYAHYSRGEADTVADGVLRATGSPPRSLAAFANEHASAFTSA